MSYVCHSGGCAGSDMYWETEGEKYGIKTISYSFGGHKQEGKNREILSTEQLNEGFEHVLIANKTIKRYPQGQARYIQNLLARNWYQVKNADVIFAICKSFLGSDANIVSGGTGWAVQMAIDNKKPVFVYDQPNKMWLDFDYNKGAIFWKYNGIPKLTENFAGIGTRELNDDGRKAIEEIYKYNLKPVTIK